MNEKELILEVIMKTIKNEVTILRTLLHGKVISRTYSYIYDSFYNIFEKIESYENKYDGIIRLQKKRKFFDNDTNIDEFSIQEEYNFEKNIKDIVKDEIDKNFIKYSERISDAIRKHEIERYIITYMEYEPQIISRIENIECPTNMRYDEDSADTCTCGGDITYRIRRRLSEEINW